MKIMMVEWLDSMSESGWNNLSYLKKNEPIKCVTIGILLEDSDSHLTVVQSVSDLGKAGESMTIPKCCVKRMRQLGVKP
jgi:hypothetical protein